MIWYNEKVLIPELKRQMPGLTVMYLTADGAPNQLKNKDLYYWISRAKESAARHPRGLWVIGFPSHSKDLSDSECGGAKHCIDKVNLEHVASDNDFGARISTVPDGVRHLRQPYPVGYATPKVDKYLQEEGHRHSFKVVLPLSLIHI